MFHGGPVESLNLTESVCLSVPEIKQKYEQLQDWDWVFGKGADFTDTLEKKFSWALIELNLEVKDGQVLKGKIYSDCLWPEFIELLNEELHEFQYSKSGIHEFIKRVRMRDMRWDEQLLEMEEWLISNV